MRTLLLTLTTCLLVLPAYGVWPLYEPMAEVVLPPGDANVPRAVEEKEGYVYLLAREGILYTYDLSDLPQRTSFATYNTPVSKQACHGNGNGVLRQGDYLYVFGRNGIQTIDVREPNQPTLLGLKNDLNTYNMVRYENYLLAAGRERLAVYSIAEPNNPTLVSDLSLGPGQLVWSAAGYGRTLYACHWISDGQGTYVNTLSVIDFSDPAHLAVLKAISRDDQAYHLRVLGNQLLECTSNQVGLWDLTTPANPVLLTSQVAGARVAAVKGNHLVTNGAVFRPDGNQLQLVATFKAGDSQRDGYPYGSAVNTSFVFLAQSKRILILNARPPSLAVNFPRGGPGSFFTIIGHGFPAKGKATMLVNSQLLGEVTTDAAGDCLFLLNTKQAGPGRYVVTTTAHPDTSASFVIAAGEPVRPQEGSGTIFQIPPGIAYAKYSGGQGTAQDPYRIATADDLIALGEEPNDYDKHFILTADIDLDPDLPGRKVFDKAVIAADTDPSDEYSLFQGTSFAGVFDGNGHMISHLTVMSGGYLGLFGELSSSGATLGGEVRNLGLVDVEISGSDRCVGALVGANCPHSSIMASYSSATVSGTRSGVGGLVGGNFLHGSVMASYSSGSVGGEGDIGGLVGFNYGTVTDCNSTGAVTGKDILGGLVGTNWGTLTDCRSRAAVTATGHTVGGLVGLNGGPFADGFVTNCYTTGPVKSSGVGGVGGVGGLVGDNWGSIAMSCSQGPVNAPNDVGGLVGRNVLSIMDSYSSGSVSGDSGVGGLVGINGGGIATSYSCGAVDGASDVGGLLGKNGKNGRTTASFWDIQTSARTTSAGGMGRTTAQMQTAKTFLDAGWDFVGETTNGTEDTWWIDEGKDYPRLSWEARN